MYRKVPTHARLLDVADRAVAVASGDKTSAIEAYISFVEKNPELAQMLSDSAMSRIFYGRRRWSLSVKLCKESRELENWVCKALRLARGQTRKASRIFREWLQSEPHLIDELQQWEIRRILEVDEGL
jgi:hypothetical protein